MKKFLPLLVLALAAFALVACGGDDDADTNGDGNGTTTAPAEREEGAAGDQAGNTISFEASADSGLAYTEDEVTAKAGKATIEFVNAQQMAHDVVIEDQAGNDIARTDIITDETATTTANLKPGEYTFYCSVPGHREAGMEGTLTVE